MFSSHRFHITFLTELAGFVEGVECYKHYGPGGLKGACDFFCLRRERKQVMNDEQ